MAVFTGRRTRRQIIDQALTKAGNSKILVQARVELNRILEKLYVEHEWPFLYKEASLTLTASTTLPTDFLRVESDDTGLRGTAVDGSTDDWAILIVSPARWRRHAVPRDETGERPLIATIDYAQSILKPWPAPDSVVTALLSYKYLPAEVAVTGTTEDATNDADIPIFPFAGYLTDVLEEWAADYDHDITRASRLGLKNRESLGLILGTAIPRDANQASEIPLDPAIFTTPPDVNTE